MYRILKADFWFKISYFKSEKIKWISKKLPKRSGKLLKTSNNLLEISGRRPRISNKLVEVFEKFFWFNIDCWEFL